MENTPPRTTFRELATAHLGCRSEDLDKILFRRTLDLHARILSWLLPKTAFAPDWLLIRDVATARSLQEVVLAVNDHRYIHPEDETTMHALKIRISGRKLIHLAREIYRINRTDADKLEDESGEEEGAID